ncbi:MAG: ATP synthase F1 subunit gamma [Lachnospiraceae bacterium]|nr:ATP synthase F1 subunit gamma [Lachnospiraceae bacterium]
MASMRDIKRRKSSIQSTGQITKAMKLVSTVKLQKAKSRAEQARPYSSYMYEAMVDMLSRTKNINHPYLIDSDNPKKAVIMITSNRGLAGGYNNNVVKLLLGGELAASKEDVLVYAIGRKGKDAVARRGYEIKADYSDVINEPEYADARAIGEAVLKEYIDGNIGEIYLAYTSFKNTVSHEPKLIKLLPINVEDNGEEVNTKEALMTFEPDEEEILDAIIPKYINSLIYGALVEAVASENGARMQAMDSATSNAEEMIADLSLKYNRARQGAITQELTEIIAGADAIS